MSNTKQLMDWLLARGVDPGEAAQFIATLVTIQLTAQDMESINDTTAELGYELPQTIAIACASAGLLQSAS